ncbi:MAG: N-acetylmuramoyl-L-alanine amidase family protein [Eubacteriales bacterium]|nr:N-acetylmuramoyl-L-alanine amidase family protein [Eubacteriales bacterium]
MGNVCKRSKIWGVLLLLLLVAAGTLGFSRASSVQAAPNKGFQTINGKTYYIDSNGKTRKGWLTLNGKKYYFNKRTGVQVKGWAKNSWGRKRYFDKKTGAMVTGWLKNSKGRKRYLSPRTGYMQTKWVTVGGDKYYFYPKSGIAVRGFFKDTDKRYRYFYKDSCAMATGWVSTSSGVKRYFYSSEDDSEDGVMAVGFSQIDGNTYYFSGSGKMATGWRTKNGKKYYFDPSSGVMYTGVQTVDGVQMDFGTDGAYIGQVDNDPTTAVSTGTRTIKNYLSGALLPVGEALYIWGGGWNDSTRKGVSPKWKTWYNSQDSSYDYNQYRDLSAANRAKGLDCSGFVGWAAYQVMQSQSGVGSGYTVVSGDIGSYYKKLGWGKVLNQTYLSRHDWTLQPGDIGYNSGHTWIVLGQCSDKSVVIVHSTPQAGCQISGTATPTGDPKSEAVVLAERYMSRYSGYTKYEYHPSCGNYIRNGNYLRWQSDVLSDPDGYGNMTADQILYDLFGS